MKLIEKYNIKEEDLYSIGVIEAKKASSSFFEKEKLKAKSLGILKPYNVKFMDLGILLDEIKAQGYHANQALIEKYGNIDIETVPTSMGLKYVVTILIVLITVFFVFSQIGGNNSIPDDWKGKKLYSVVDGRDWIIINDDNTFTLHEYIPNSEETYEWNGKIKNMELITSKPLSYHGRNDYKPTEIDSKIEMMDIGGKFLRINFKGFNTISGSYETDGRNYTPENRSPF
jgi:hypothetical protein